MHRKYLRDITVYWLILAVFLLGLLAFHRVSFIRNLRLLDLCLVLLITHTFFYFLFVRRHIRALEHRQKEIQSLYEVAEFEVSNITTTVLKTSELMERTLALVLRVLKADACSIMLLNTQGVLSLELGKGVRFSQEGVSLKVGEGIAGWVVKHGKSLTLADAAKDLRFVPFQSTQGIRSLACVPLKVGQKVIGVLNVSRLIVSQMIPEELAILETIASRAALAIENADIFRKFQDEKMMLDRIINTASNAMICLDKDKNVLFMNQKGEELTGWIAEEIIGRHFCRDVIQMRDQRGHLVCNLNCPLEKACQKDDRSAVSEGFLITKGGGQVWVESEYSAITGLSSELLFGVVTLRDISGRKKAERLRLQLTSNIVHELKTPLTYIRGYVDLMMMGNMGKLNQEQQKALNVIQDSVFRLLTLIDNLLEVARIEEGRFYLQFGTVSIKQIVEKSVNLAKSEAMRKNIELTLEVQNLIPEIYADGKRLEEVVMNLLSNALKYTSSGGKVWVTLAQEGDKILLLVKDTGIGIAPEYIKSIFSRFAQVDFRDGGRPGEGAGLGLNIVMRVVEAHGGDVHVESEVGKGATFHVLIPCRKLK